MSIHSIKQYQSEVEKIIQYGGTKKETAIRNVFYNLLNEYAKQRGLMLIPEISIKGTKGKTVTPDGTLKDSLRLDWGYWESKDEADILDDEIEKKFKAGYPNVNILFEDSINAVLIQGGYEIMRITMSDADALDAIIKEFIGYERPEVATFHKAIEFFKQDIPKVTDTIRSLILSEETTNQKFKTAESTFWELCRESINPQITKEDIREMMIQHILTEDIFNTIFDETQFHRENNIARELEQVILTFFTGKIKHTALDSIQHYYKAINAAAAQIADHHEKQKFLKVIYEVFYKGYNPKAADRLGVVYTPNEIVKFMIQSTNYLLFHHFGKGLEDKGVEILDPATGTGTFICDIIDFIPKDKLAYKYEHEIHSNEIAILPYYIANLNIEYTYKQKMGEYKEFENLCFVDTLENLGFDFIGKQGTLWEVSAENAQRIKRQNSKKISVIIGNPPYNANQMNENDNNKNREYYLNYSKKTGGIDGRIKDTFIKYSTAQKTKVYDMYARFYRWAFDRLDKNGVIAFITNRSFIDSRTFDGFRKCVQNDFDYAYIIDTKSDVRTNPKIAGTTHNVFGIQTGVAIMFLVKKIKKETPICQIRYVSLDDFWRKEDKLNWISSNSLQEISFEKVIPDKNNNWINLGEENDWDELLPLCSKDVKSGKDEKSIIESYSLGVATNRDEWVYDFNKNNLERKIKYFIDTYNKEIERWNYSKKDVKINDFVNRDIKWTSELESYLIRKTRINFDVTKIRKGAYRCFVNCNLYFDKIIIHRPYLNEAYFGIENQYINKTIVVNTNGLEFNILATSVICNNHFNGDSQCMPFLRYDKLGNSVENITNWSLRQFLEHYKLLNITKENIFHYVYAVLHNPSYRKKYELNLKRDFPRIPFYDDFYKWAAWGKALMDLHINYETVEPFKLQEINTEVVNPKAKLKADKEGGIIILDESMSLTGVPKEAWDYKLGNRSALEWVLDQYKEKKPTDPTIADKFNTYKFADYKDQVIYLLKRVCRVSVETMKIIDQMN